MWIREIIVVWIGLCAGLAVAGGLYSFIAMVGVLTRLATKTNTASQVKLYEDMVSIGAAVGNWFNLMPFHIPFGRVLLILYGISSGVFIGCLAIALAEVLNVIPTFIRRAKITTGLSFIVCGMAIGKLIGTLFQMVFMGNK